MQWGPVRSRIAWPAQAGSPARRARVEPPSSEVSPRTSRPAGNGDPEEVAVVASNARSCAEERRLFNDWLPFAIYGFLSLMIPSTMIVASFVLATRPKQRVRARTLPFESGVSTGSPPKQRFTVSFYLTAMLFILFDIEIVFLYPLAVILHQLAWFGFFEFLVFLAILLLAYVYIWRKGALEWR
jgi:NADH-quinone oxidoreductase subunit A